MLPASDSDEPLIVRLIVRHEREMRGYARALLPAWEAVDDVLQEASSVMWKKRDQLDDQDGFLPWAKSIIRFEALRALRNMARDRLVLSDVVIALLADEAMETPPGQLDRERRALQDCLGRLSSEHRKLVMIPYVDPGGIQEMAGRVDRSPNSLYKLLGRLRVKFRTCVERELAKGGVI